MPILWLPSTVPELAEMRRLPPAERKAIANRVLPRVRRHWQFWAGAAAALAVAVAVFIPVSRLLAGQDVRGLLNGLIAGAAAGLPAGTLLAQVLNRLSVPYYREELAARSGPGMSGDQPPSL